jgi:hypothetical protein
VRHTWASRAGRVGAKRARIGDVFSDAWDTVTDPVTSAWDDAKKVVPGLSDLSDAIDSFASGPLKDFAKTAVGKVVLTAISGGAYMAVAPAVGAQLAAATFALPGMARGEKFAQAWTEAFVERITALIKYFIGQGLPEGIADTKAGQIAQDVIDRCAPYADQLGKAGFDFFKLARLAGIREDFAALYIAQQLGDMRLYTDHQFDVATGNAIVGPSWADAAKRAAEKVRQAAIAEQARSAARGEERRALAMDPAFRVLSVMAEGQPLDQTPAPGPDLTNLTGSGPVLTTTAAPAPTATAGLSTPAKVAVGVGLLGALAAAARALRWV